MKNQLNKELIERLNETNNRDFFEVSNDFISRLTYSVLNDIAQKSPFIKIDKCVFLPANEIFLGTFTQLSQLTYILGVENAQIEMNTKDRKNFLRFMWREFKAGFRLGRKKYKKKKNQVVPAEVTKYKISDFRHDFMLNASNYLQESSMIYEYDNHISMVGKDDFGSNIKVNIYFCSYDSSNQNLKFFRANRNKYIEVNFGKRFINLREKFQTCGDRFVDMVKIFNALFSKIYNRVPNQILIESLIYSCPDSLFDSDLYYCFVNVANYIRLANPRSFASVCNAEMTIFEEPLITKTNSQVDFGKVISMLDNYKY